jgi:hypothetical protein
MHLKDRIDSHEGISYILTLLLFNRSIDLSKYEYKKKMKNLDYSTITDPQRTKYTIPTGFIKEFVKINKLQISDKAMEFSLADIYLSVKGGPQGKASLTALNNFHNFGYDTLDRLFKLTTTVGIEYLSKSYSYWFDNFDKFPKRINHLGKLSIIKDPEGKLRIIAIVDYYTQLFLKKLHHNLLLLIKNSAISGNDRTFTQDPFHKWDDNDHKFWSLDLSSATDRFPRLLQARLLAVMMNNHEYAMTWERHLGKLEFQTLDGNTVKYSVGQPMGTYSSWICFTWAHHLVVHYAAKLSGIDNFSQYIILGDDIVIKHDIVAKNYIRIINKMGVDISLTKTHVSKDTYEFAKRWIKANREVSGIPLRGILHNFKNPYIIFMILYDHFKIKKNSFLSKLSLVDSIESLYNRLYLIRGKKKYFPIRKIRLVILKLRTFSTLLDIVFGYANNQSIRNMFIRNITNELYCIPDEKDSLLEIKKILSIGLKNNVLANVNRLTLFSESLLQKYESITDKNFIRYDPTFIGIYNYIRNLYDKTQTWEVDANLANLFKDMIIIDIDKVYSKERIKYSSLFTLSSSIEKGFKVVNQTDEIYYGSSSVVSTFDPSGLEVVFKNSIELEDLNTIVENRWVEPAPKVSYADAWANFKM